jgi:ribosome-associated protein
MNRQNDETPLKDPAERKSKSQVKRDMKALQKIGERLVGLPPSQREKIALPEELREALEFAATLKKHEARRRQVKYIGVLMRHMDTEAITADLEDIEGEQRRETLAFHRIEKWRDELINNPAANLDDVVKRFPESDRQRLMQLIRNARKERDLKRPPKSSRDLFRYLRELEKREENEPEGP